MTHPPPVGEDKDALCKKKWTELSNFSAVIENDLNGCKASVKREFDNAVGMCAFKLTDKEYEICVKAVKDAFNQSGAWSDSHCEKFIEPQRRAREKELRDEANKICAK